MAYKRQSKKRKSPLKGAGDYGHKASKTEFTVDVEAASEAGRSKNLTGRAIGAAGTAVGDAVQEIQDNKPNKTSPDAVNQTADANKPTLGVTTPPDQQIATQAPATPQIGSAIQLPGAIDFSNPDVGATDGLLTKENNAFTAGGIGGSALSDATDPVKKWKALSPEIGDIEIGADSGFKDETLTESGFTPLTRWDNTSPFHRMGALRRSPLYKTDGKTMGELAQSSLTNVTYLGGLGQAAAQGYNSQVDRHNYAQQVRAEQAKELDEEFGSLEAEPSGNKAYDASVEGLAREWKTEFVDAKKQWKAGKMSNEDWITTKHRLQGNASDYSAAAKNLQQGMKNWLDNKGNISNSTKPEIVDFFNTMEKSPDSLTVQNIDGVSTFVGETLGGKPINIPVDKIANGQNAFRFNTKFDVGKATNAVVKDLASLKTDVATEFGIGTGNLGFDNPMIQNRVNSQIDNLVKNDAQLRSIAGELGLEYDTFEEALAAEEFKNPGKGMDTIRQQVKDQLVSQVKESYVATQKTSRFDQDEQQDDTKIDQAQQRIDAAANKVNISGPNAGLTPNQAASREVKRIENQQIENKLAEGLAVGYKNIVGIAKIEQVKPTSDGQFKLKIDGKWTTKSPVEIESYIKNVTGWTPAYKQGGGYQQYQTQNN